MDFELSRVNMVESQVRINDVTDPRLIHAMRATPRESFVSKSHQASAYADMLVPSAEGRWLLCPRDFSKLVNVCAIRPEDRVLDIGSGSGYSAAILARLAASVVALEQDETAKALGDCLAAAGVAGIEIVAGPLKNGAPGKAPFDVIFVGGAVEDVPAAWLAQLAEGGRLAVPVSEGGVTRARIYTASGGKAAWRAPFDMSAPVLPGLENAPEFRL